MMRIYDCLVYLTILLSVLDSVESLEINIGIFSKNLTNGNLTTIFYNEKGWFCNSFSFGREEACKYYGECCGDVVRIRERLEHGTYQCMAIGDTQG